MIDFCFLSLFNTPSSIEVFFKNKWIPQTRISESLELDFNDSKNSSNPLNGLQICRQLMFFFF